MYETGIIPARAGFTVCAAWAARGGQDHPRSRGVYLIKYGLSMLTAGSSPLARGLPKTRIDNEGVLGIIPARAGFTATLAQVEASGKDHPRSRGVYRVCTRPLDLILGSSPLARGLLLVGRPSYYERRIIPARAGFTSGPRHRPGDRQDHPRSRGVYRQRRSCARFGAGSSPLARGLPFERRGGHLLLRIIPARAGFTYWRWTGTRPQTDHPRSRGVYPTGSTRSSS